MARQEVKENLDKMQVSEDRETRARLEQERLLKVIEDRENFETTNTDKQMKLRHHQPKKEPSEPLEFDPSYKSRDEQGARNIVQSTLYNDYMRQANFDVMKEQRNNEQNREQADRQINLRQQAHSLLVTCFSCATPGHVGVPCTKLDKHPLFKEVSPNMVYPHEKIQYIAIKEHAEVQDHATSPIFLKERAPGENKLSRETQARGYPTIAQTDYPYRNSKAGKSKGKEDIVNREYQNILEDIPAVDWEETLDSDSAYGDDSDNDINSLVTSDEDSSDGYKEFIGEFHRGKSRFKGKVKILKKQLEQGKATKRRTKLRKSGKIPTCCNHNPDVVQQDKMTKEQRDPMGFYNIQPTQPPSQLLQPPPHIHAGHFTKSTTTGTAHL